MKTILKFLSIVAVLLLINGCKEKDCVGVDCPLSDGSHCPNNMININDNCTCPDGFTEFNQNCYEKESIPNTFIGDLSCTCLKDVYISLDTTFIVNSVFYDFVLNNGEEFGNQANASGNQDNFSFLMFGNVLNCNQDNSIQVEFKGSINGDTLNANIYWRQQGPNWDTPIDSCVGLKIPRL